MTSPIPALFQHWTRKQATILAFACLAAGIAGGWGIRGLRHQTAVVSAEAANVPGVAVGRPSAPAHPGPAALKSAADAQAAPLTERLKSNPADPLVLTALGNLYYDAQQYSAAIDFYQRALRARPTDAAVRTDMATAYWYMGNADSAIAEFNKALAYAPDNPNTLFNRGLVEWQGKKNAAAALADWQRLLKSDPGYDQKDKVQQMIAEVKAHQAGASTPKSR
jgi:cytochrome c-type biogenesis protein CcmH/NrfG